MAKEQMDYKVIEVQLDKPLTDLREYQLIELKNKLQCLLISDPETDKSAAAMDVKVGYFMDPENVAGLAHFLEHMLFLGTKKYPEQGAYQAFISKNGGTTNAYTDMNNTNYQFEITNEKLEEALDRFAQFFISPLFNEDGANREMKAVHSEHCKNLQNDTWRTLQLLKSTCNKKHPFSKFGTGSLETLSDMPKKAGLNIRDELIKFYEQHYSSNIMKLCVMGKEPIDVLRKIVVEKFSNIENKNVIIPKFNDIEVFHSTDQIRNLFKIVPVKDTRNIVFLFPMPFEVEKLYLKKPLNYFSHLVGHEGAGSLSSLLKSKGWLHDICSSPFITFSDQTLFFVEFDVSDEGEKHLYEIGSLLFQYIKMLKDAGVKKWIFDEIKAIASMGFKFMDKMNPFDFTTTLASNMQKFRPEHIISGPTIIDEFDEDIIGKYLDLINPQNMFIYFQSKSNQSLENLEKEKWYGTLHQVQKIDENWIKQWSNPKLNEDMRFPEPNEFIPKNFDIKALEDEQQFPFLLKKSKLIEMWYKQDNIFKQPKADCIFNVIIPNTYGSPQNYIAVNLYCALVVDDLKEFSYNAGIAGCNYSLDSTRTGVNIMFSGYDDKIELLRQTMFNKFKSFEPKKQRFDIIKRKITLEFENSLLNQPYAYGFSKTDQLFIQNKYHIEEFLSVIKDVTFEFMNNFIPVWKKSMRIQCLIHGNITRKEALSMFENIENDFCKGVQAISESQEPYDRIIKLDDPADYVLPLSLPNPEDTNSSLEVINIIGLDNPRDAALLDLLNQMLETPYYEQLRTEEQLGYIVTSRPRLDYNVLSLSCIIQSEKDPHFLIERHDTFMETMYHELKGIEEEELNEVIQALIQVILEKEKQLNTMSLVYYSEIYTKHYQFDRKFKKAEELKKIGKADLLEFFEKYINTGSNSTRRVIVQVFSQKQSEKMNEKYAAGHSRKLIQIDDITKFKQSSTFYPAVISDIKKFLSKE